MSPLEIALLKTLNYFHLWSYPLTLLELKKWLWEYQENSIPNILAALTELQKKKLIAEKQGYYFLIGQDAQVGIRLNRYRLAEYKLKKSRIWLKILSLTPWVKGIFLCNTLAYFNSRKESDVDLLVLTEPGTIWRTRFFMTSLTKIFGLRPHPQHNQDKLCLSFFLTTDNLNLEPLKIAAQDIYLTYWIEQILPIYQTEDAYGKFWRANTWIKKYLPQAQGYKLAETARLSKPLWQRKIKKILTRIPGEHILASFQKKILPKKLHSAEKNSGVVLSDKILKFHAPDNREKYQQLWQESIKLSLNIPEK